MTKAEQARIVAWRLRILRHAEEEPRYVAQTCRYFWISPTAFYRWKKRFDEFGETGVADRPRTPHHSPRATSPAVVSKLSVWWLRLGIHIKRIKPGHPEQNGRHERMHLTLKKEATKPAAENFLVQQARFDNFIGYYNQDRPHQALDMKMPAELYKKSPRPYRGLGDLEYPFHDRTALVTNCVWLVSFMQYDLGYFDAETCRLEPIQDPFRANVLPM